MSTYEPSFGYSLNIVELQYPTEGKVIDIDKPIREEESSISLLGNYRLKVIQKFKLQDSLTNMTFIENRYNMVMTRGKQNHISLYDTSLPPDRNDGIDSFERLIEMDGHQGEGYGMDWNLHRDAYAISADF